MLPIKHCIGVHHINTLEKFLLVLAIVLAGAFGIFYAAKTYPATFETAVTVKNVEDVRFRESIGVDFSLPVFTKYYNSKIKIVPVEDYELQWENSSKRLKIIPRNFWKPETKYEIAFPFGRNVMFSGVEARKVSFSTEKYPKVTEIVPKNNSNNALIGIEDPVTVNFDKSAADFSLKFVWSPEDELSVQGNAAKTQFKLLPKNGTDYETQYNLEVYAKAIEDEEDNYQKIYESSFVTAPPPTIVWDKDYGIRLGQAKKYTRAKIKTGKYIDVNLSSQVMSIFENGKILDAFMVSSGQRGMDTPKGMTQIYNKFPRAYSPAYGLYMPYWMAIAASGKFGLHELPEWPNGYKEGASHLGIPVSHGCVRMGVGAAEKVYNFAEIGTPVLVY